MSAYSLELGDVLSVLSGFQDNSFDALLCDPPYGLKFMGKAWDYDVPSVEVWRECLRVLKPGAPLVAFGGSRTYHRLAVGIEDAGFELRDCLMFLYGKGFPKSQNIALAIDKAAGAVREVVGTRVLTGNAALSTAEKCGTYGVQVGSVPAKTVNVTAPATDLAKAWDGYGTALKPAFEPIVLARKPLEGTMVRNVGLYGVGGLAIDACRIESDDLHPVTQGGQRGEAGGFGMGRSTYNPNDAGRWPANLILSHTEGCRVVGTKTEKGHKGYPNGPGGSSCQISQKGVATSRTEAWSGHPDREVEAWDCTPDCPVRLLDAQGAHTKSVPFGMGEDRTGDNVAAGAVLPLTKRTAGGYSDAGGPSRFYYCAKVSTKEREAGCEHLPKRSAGEVTDSNEDDARLDSPRTGAGRTGGARNIHPTLKPLSLTTWLARLILPPTPSPVLLVPFAGAGSEMIGALKAGWAGVFGIEREAEYVEIARARLRHWCPDCEGSEAA